MNELMVERKYALEYIKDTLRMVKDGKAHITESRYHHNADYCDATSICKNGILTMLDLKRLGIKDYSLEILMKSDHIESHVNGNDAVSLSVVGLQDLYPDEFEYNPFNPTKVDFLVSDSIKTIRNSTHYGNEFLSYSSIPTSKLESIDIRLLKLICLLEKTSHLTNSSVDKVVENYNFLRETCAHVKNFKLGIPVREMSVEDGSLIDISKLSSAPKLILK